jgi:hypothetical protein
MKQNENNNLPNENFETFTIDKTLENLEYIIFELTINKDPKH